MMPATPPPCASWPLAAFTMALDRLVEQIASHDPEDPPGGYFFLREDFLRLRGTFAPERRASDRPMAIACFLLVTFLPERPLRNVPRFRSRMTCLTLRDAFLPYLRAIKDSYARSNLFYFGLRPKPPDELFDLVLHQHLLDARLDFGQRGELRRTHVVELNDVVAEARVHRRLRVLAFLELHHRVGELLVVGGRHVPVEVAAALCAAGVLGVLAGELVELAPLLELGDDAFRLVFA